MSRLDSSHTHGILQRLVSYRLPMLVAAAALTALAAWPSTQLRFDTAITNLFPPDDPVLVAYQESLRLFGGGPCAR
jgi:predicted RND superfamily exporter protein